MPLTAARGVDTGREDRGTREGVPDGFWGTALRTGAGLSPCRSMEADRRRRVTETAHQVAVDCRMQIAELCERRGRRRLFHTRPPTLVDPSLLRARGATRWSGPQHLIAKIRVLWR
jgi:hypothetical protein